MQIIKRIKNFILKRKKKKVDKKKEVINELKKLYNLMKFIDSKFTNRREKKQFWRDFIKHGKVREDVIVYLIKNSENFL